ncbi:DUF4424 domain-containing protein [Jiella sp. M17.18]|uniref:DUF4424 domain-containing protein n=1 Tax=Jiella sp. M17.18 TaxID=3234247 RepID=UPI0034DEE695
MIRPLLVVTLLCGSALAARANDTTANLAVGGLVFTRTNAVAMRSEALSISQQRVDVAYVFVNESEQPVTTTVAFPLPTIQLDPFDFNVDIPSDDPGNPFAFRTSVDGQPVTMAVDRAAFVGDRNVTAILQKLGVAFAPPTEATTAALDALPQPEKKRLEAAGIAKTDSFDAGKGWETHLAPAWAYRITYHWDQTFPPGRPVSVTHSYKPSVGATVATPLGSKYATPQEIAEKRKRYCIEDDLMRTVAKRTRAAEASGGIGFSERWIDYVLTTGANWAKPIGSFSLSVDKGAPQNLVSFCATGVTKIGPTRFQVKKQNFLPKSDLAILILVPGS